MYIARLLQDIGQFCCWSTENDGYVVGDVPAHVANYTFHPTLAPLVPPSPSDIFASFFFVRFFGSWTLECQQTQQHVFFFFSFALLLFLQD